MKVLYEFGPFRVDPDRSLLLRGEESVALTPKAFETLLVLVQRRQETVSKDTLLKTVWPDTFVEEANLTQHVSMLRKALGETPQDRRYIMTVPGRGYRFVARVRQLEAGNETRAIIERDSHPRSDVSVEESKAGENRSDPSAAEIVPFSFSGVSGKTMLLLIASLVVVLAIGTGVTMKRVRRGAALSDKDSILLADFDNSTGEPLFDGTLKEGLAVELEQSPFLDIVTQDRVRETLRYAGRSPDTRVLPPLAANICRRIAAKAMVSGAIARLGSRYVVAVEALNCVDGRTLASEQVEVRNKDQVLAALGKIASRLRGRLGESLGSIQQFDTPIEQATTPSLEALRAYSLGNEQRTQGMEKQAIPLFEHAIELDPNFAMAYAQLGGVYSNLGETEQSSEYLKKAFSLRGSLSEREKLFLTVRYYTVVTGETDKALETYEMWARIYPRDPAPFNGLAARYQIVGQYEKAAEAGGQALRLEPNSYLPYANLALSFLALNQLEQAKEVCQRANIAHRDSIYTHKVLFDIAFLNHDQSAMQRESDWAGTSDRENDMLTTEGLAQLASGQLKSARELFERSWASSRRGGLNNDAAYSMAGEALAEADFGNYRQARAGASKALSLGRGIDAEETAAEVLALAGDSKGAQTLVDDLRHRFPHHMPLNLVSIPAILATMELQRGNPAKAVQILEPALPYDFCEFANLAAVYIRANAYLRMHSAQRAAAEFQKILDHEGVDIPSQRHPLALLGMARALALEGNAGGSRKAYEDFFAQWSHADPDVSPVRQAKKEYARLRKS